MKNSAKTVQPAKKRKCIALSVEKKLEICQRVHGGSIMRPSPEITVSEHGQSVINKKKQQAEAEEVLRDG